MASKAKVFIFQIVVIGFNPMNVDLEIDVDVDIEEIKAFNYEQAEQRLKEKITSEENIW